MKFRHILMGILSLCTAMAMAAQPTSLRIAVDEWPPYEFKTGEPGNQYISGFSTEVVLAVLKQMGVGVNGKIEQYPWARGEKMVIDGSTDVLFTAATNEKRAQVTHYPNESLMESSWSFFIRKEDEKKIKFDSLNDLKGRKVGVVRSYSYTPELWAFLESEKNFEEVTVDEQNVKKLISSRLDYVAMDYGNGLALLKSMGLLDKVVPLKNPIKSISLYAIFSRNTVEKEFVDAFSEKLKAFKKTNEYKLIFDKYFGK